MRRTSRLLRASIIAGVAIAILLLMCSAPLLPRALVRPAVPAVARDAAVQSTARGPGATATPRATSPARGATPVPAGLPPGPTLLPPSVPPGPMAASPLSDLGRILDQHLADLAGIQLFQGAVLVARDGTIILSKGYGMADAEAGAPNTTRTRFRLASLTKMFTAMAIMQLAAQHKLDVHDSICAYLDDCPQAWRAITIHHLLTHTSGIPNYTDFADYDATQMQPATPAQLVARFRDLPLLFAPGTSYSYANSDYVLLGLIVERTSGETYEAFLRERIFEPLQMRDSGVGHSAEELDDQAIGYQSPGARAPALDPSTLFSAGALYSTVEDLYRWDQALYTDRLLPPALRDTMFTPALGRYGYGWQVEQLGGHRALTHPGKMDGFETFLARYPDDHLTVIVLSNLSGVDAAGIGNYLATLVLGS